MAARELFDQIIADGWEGLDIWCKSRREETSELEFKQSGRAAPKVNGFDQENIGKTVSGFANADGGVLLIGVQTDKIDDVDRATALQPVQKVGTYVEAIRRHLSQCTRPVVKGVTAKGIEQPGAADTGVVAIFVPPSEEGPYRASAAGDKWSDRYFARFGGETVVLDHTTLAVMFGRQPSAHLGLRVRHVRDRTYEFFLSNAGRGTARRISVRLAVRGSAYRHPPWELVGLDRSFEEPGWKYLSRTHRTGKIHTFVCDNDFLLYPDDEVRIGSFEISQPHSHIHMTARLDADGCRPTRVRGFLPVLSNSESFVETDDDGGPSVAL